MKSTYVGKLTFDASSFVVDEITLVGSRCGPFASALELLYRWGLLSMIAIPWWMGFMLLSGPGFPGC